MSILDFQIVFVHNYLIWGISIKGRIKAYRRIKRRKNQGRTDSHIENRFENLIPSSFFAVILVDVNHATKVLK